MLLVPVCAPDWWDGLPAGTKLWHRCTQGAGREAWAEAPDDYWCTSL